METKELKEKLHIFIENSSEDKLKYIYSFFEENNYDDTFKMMLDNEFASYQTDKSGDTREEVSEMIKKYL